jgi:hypothetical protein
VELVRCRRRHVLAGQNVLQKTVALGVSCTSRAMPI